MMKKILLGLGIFLCPFLVWAAAFPFGTGGTGSLSYPGGANALVGINAANTAFVATGTPALTAGYFIATTTATSTFNGGVNLLAINQTGTATSTFNNGIQLASGCFQMPNGTCLSQGGSGTVTSVGLSVPSLLSVSGSPITGSGSFTVTWNGVSQGDILYGSAANTVAVLAKDTNATRYLSNTGTTNNPAWAQINLANGITGVLPIINGGTNASVQTNNTLLWFNGTSITATSSNPLTVGNIIATTTATSSFGGSLTQRGVLNSAYRTPGFTYATSTTWTGTTTIPLPSPFYNQTIDNAQCYTDIGTLNVDFYHTATHFSSMFNASTTQGTVTFTGSNTMLSAEKWFVDIGTPATLPTKITCTLKNEFTSY